MQFHPTEEMECSHTSAWIVSQDTTERSMCHMDSRTIKSPRRSSNICVISTYILEDVRSSLKAKDLRSGCDDAMLRFTDDKKRSRVRKKDGW